MASQQAELGRHMRLPRRGLICIATAIVAIGAIAAVPAPSSHRIHLDRPSRAGMKSAIEYFVSRYIRDEILRAGNSEPVIAESSTIAQLSVNWEILQADDRGNTLAQAMTVLSFTAIRNNIESIILPRGSRIVATATDSGTTFTVNGAPADENVRSVLDIVVGLSTTKRAASLDQIYGSAAPREVGESWPLNIDNLAATYVRRGVTVRPRDISGDVKLIAVEPYADELCLRISTLEQLNAFTREPSTPRTGMSLRYADDCTMTVRNDYWIPATGNAKVLRVVTTSEATYDIQGTLNGQRFTDEQFVRHTSYTRRIPRK